MERQFSDLIILLAEHGYPPVDRDEVYKEIFEQADALANTMRGRLNEDDATSVFGGLNLTAQQLRSVDRIILTACGTS